MAKKKIFVSKKTGGVIALCDNKIDNTPALGDRIIKRAADVEFNNDLKKWEILSPGGEILGQGDRRDTTIALEITLVEKQIKEDLTNGQVEKYF